MSLRAGTLPHRITILQKVESQDPTTGIVTEEFLPLPPDLWARVEPAGARDFFAAGIENTEITYKVTIRYREGIERSMRIQHGNRVYNIYAALVDANREWIVMPCSEVVNG